MSRISALNTARILMALLFVLASSLQGCATFTPVWISASKIDATTYRSGLVGVLPIVVNPNFQTEGLPLTSMVGAIKDNLYSAGLHNAEVVPADRLDPTDTEFPHTPLRMTRNRLNSRYDGYVGMSVVSWSRETAYAPATMSAVISYVSVKDGTQRWFITKRWQAQSVAELPSAMRTSLPGDFEQLRVIVTSGGRSWLILKTTELSKAGPALSVTLSGGDSISNSSTTADYADYTVVAIDDAGIAGVDISNPAAKFVQQLGYDLRSTESSKSEPIYVSGNVRVPISPGENAIEFSAANGRGEKTVQRTTVGGKVRRDGLSAVVIGIEHYASLPSARSGDSAARRFGEAVDRLRSSATSSVISLYEKDATRSSVLGAAEGARDTTRESDARLLYFSGRAAVVKGSAYLVLQDASSGYSDFGSLSMQDLGRFFGSGHNLGIIEVCAGPSEIEQVKKSLTAELPSYVIGSVHACDVELWPLADAAVSISQETSSLSKTRSNISLVELLGRLRSDSAALVGTNIQVQ